MGARRARRKFTVSAVVLTLPKASCSWTVIGPSVALLEAPPDTAPVVKIQLCGRRRRDGLLLGGRRQTRLRPP